VIALVVGAGALIIFLAVTGFGSWNLSSRWIFVLWGAFLIVMALAGYYWWGKGIFKPRPPRPAMKWQRITKTSLIF